jgi:hypothetical protein
MCVDTDIDDKPKVKAKWGSALSMMMQSTVDEDDLLNTPSNATTSEPPKRPKASFRTAMLFSELAAEVSDNNKKSNQTSMFKAAALVSMWSKASAESSPAPAPAPPSTKDTASNAKIAALERDWDQFDSDDSGGVTQEELTRALTERGVALDKIEDLFEEIDSSNDGIITKEEFGSGYGEYKRNQVCAGVCCGCIVGVLWCMCGGCSAPSTFTFGHLNGRSPSPGQVALQDSFSAGFLGCPLGEGSCKSQRPRHQQEDFSQDAWIVEYAREEEE